MFSDHIKHQLRRVPSSKQTQKIVCGSCLCPYKFLNCQNEIQRYKTELSENLVPYENWIRQQSSRLAAFVCTEM